MSTVGPLILLFSLAGGYAFLQRCYWFKHRWDALEWERNLFEAALVGGCLFVGARLTLPWLLAVPVLVWFRNHIHAAMPYPYTASFVASLGLALILAWLVNRVIPREQAIHRAVARHGGELLILLQHAARHSLPVSLTMANRKVYVGFVVAPPSPKYPYTKVLPTVSGHRETDTLNLVLTTPYWRVYQDLERRRQAGEKLAVDVNDFGIVLPIAQVCSANLFDDDTYARYFDIAAAPPTPEPPPLPAVQQAEAAGC